MGAVVAILQSHPALLRCQVERLAGHVSLADQGAPTGSLPGAYGFGSYAARDVLLGKRPSGAPVLLSIADLVGAVEGEALLVHAGRSGAAVPNDENTQPFRFRRWLFALDGAVEGWERVRPRLLASLPDFLRRSVQGETDAEAVFAAVLAQLRTDGLLDDLDLDPRALGRALARTVDRLDAWSREEGATTPGRLGLVATNGRALAATRRGGPLSYALLEGILPCPRHGLTAATADSDPQLVTHRRARAVCLATHVRTPNGFIEVPPGSVISVSRTLAVSVAPIHGQA